MSLQHGVRAAKRMAKFLPSDGVRPTDGLHALNVRSCFVNKLF